MQTSQRGIAFLERHEGVVLRAYRCPAGHWTIGAGLTAASGVVTPKPGMVITRKEATRLLAVADTSASHQAVRLLHSARTLIRVRGTGLAAGPWTGAALGDLIPNLWNTDPTPMWTLDPNAMWSS